VEKQPKKHTTDAREPSSAAGFVMIERAFLRDPRLTPEEKLVGCIMASYANAGHLAWPGTKTVAKQTGFGRNKVNRARAKLVKSNHLVLVQTRLKQSWFGRSRYEVTGKILHRAKCKGANENAASDRLHDSHARGGQPHKVRR
jgi:hypothetical protein